jgi:hypothetical protein
LTASYSNTIRIDLARLTEYRSNKNQIAFIAKAPSR